MNKTVIRAQGLCKRYRLYHNRRHRLLDAFGLLLNPKGKFDTHTALDDINLEIHQGEKIAVIGRNGAGKSTLLKLICQVIRPSSGKIDISGNVHPLLEIGTGFLPDFTGRENVYAYLANLGVADRDVEQKFAEIVDFSELEEYIDQPTKTYSTGMKMRLMFAASTAIEPDILILDEVLSVGDAYFTQKSYERIKSLCRGNSTLILVTHDISSAMSLCERFLWIDEGRIRADGPSSQVHHVYANSIREQEEKRLRKKRMAIVKQNLHEKKLLYGYIQCDDHKGKIYISDMHFQFGIKKLSSKLPEIDNNQEPVLITDSDESNWGEETVWQGKTAREFSKYGSVYHKLPFTVVVPEQTDISNVKLDIECYSDSENTLKISLFPEQSDQVLFTRLCINETEQWVKQQLSLSHVDNPSEHDFAAVMANINKYGSRRIELTDIRFFDENECECHAFTTGGFMKIRLFYEINDDSLDEYPTIVATFHKDQVIRSHRFWTDKIKLSAKQRNKGTIDIIASPLLLGQGLYNLSFTIFKEGYLNDKQVKTHFATTKHVYYSALRAHEILISENTNRLYNDVIYDHPSEWFIDNQS